MKNSFLLYVSALLGAFTVNAQQGNSSALSIKEIMKGDDFIGHLPSSPQWSADGNYIYFNWNPEGTPSDSLYSYGIKTKKIGKVDFETEYALPSARFVYNRDKSKKVYEKHGDVFLMDMATGSIIQVTDTEARESNVHFTANGSKLAFVKEENIYTWDLSSGVTVQMTNFTEKEEKAAKKSERDQWLQNDQLALFDVLKERRAEEDQREKLMERYKKKGPFEISKDGKSVSNQQISPDGNYITYLMVKRPKDQGTIVPHYVTETGYTEDQNTRSKVGDEPTEYEMWIYDLSKRKTYRVTLKNLEGLDYVPEYTTEYPDKQYKNENRIGYISGPSWSADGKKAVLDINTNDYKDRWIVRLNPADGTVTGLDHQHDEAWIAGPGIGGYGGGDLGWMPDDRHIWFLSEKTGFAHLYTLDVESNKTKALTSGKFEIYDPFLSKDGSRWYFTSNMEHPGDRQFYTMSQNGGKPMQLTDRIGNNEVVLSPDERSMAVLHSYTNKPTELYLGDNPLFSKSANALQQITKSTTKAFDDYQWRDPEIVTFKAGDGAEVYARLYTPKPELHNGAAVIFVHGAGYLQNAHKWWSSYYREYMFHNLLVDNGYTVLDIDYRGSAGYGRDWRTGIYRHMGGKDLSDQVDGANFLVEKHGVQSDKIGIYGGSYGGFITLMGMFNAPDTFSAGATIRSVGDWAAYNHGYTARILNTPVTDSLAYRRSSPIYFAEGLKGDLLILHGMVDDNVHFQDMVRLSQRLIELGKENWEMAVYPVERHGFVEPSSWTDEYTRIFNLFQESLLGREHRSPQ
ncbi:MAG: prolyl oligopeptidase family serine peptidase [Sediminicola sp.]